MRFVLQNTCKVSVLPDEWPLEMTTKLESFPLAHLHLPGLLRPPGRTRVSCPRLLQSMLSQLFTVFTASCLRQAPMRTGTRKTTLRSYNRENVMRRVGYRHGGSAEKPTGTEKDSE